MPTTNRPFFANFFAAFRTQSYFHKASAGAVTPSSKAAVSTCSAPSPSSSTAPPHAHSHTQPRPIGTKTQPQTTSSTAAAVAAHAAATFQSSRSPRATSAHQGPPTAAARHRHPSAASARQHSTSPIPGSHAPSATSPTPYTPQRGSFQRSRTPSQTRMGGKPTQRRGSDSSGSDSGGFKDAVGPQGWYIGGRTPAGDEKFYRLGMVKRWSSADRLSLDRLSL